MAEEKKSKLDGWREQYEERPELVAAIEKAATEHGEDKIGVLHTLAGVVVCRKSTRGEYKRFKSEALDERKKADATEHLVRSCIVHPDKKTFDAWLEEYPAIDGEISKTILKLSGSELVDQGKG